MLKHWLNMFMNNPMRGNLLYILLTCIIINIYIYVCVCVFIECVMLFINR